jgi:hypothetical protein
MSTYLYGNKGEAKKLASIIKGSSPFDKKLPVTIPSIKGQRITKESTLVKFLKSEGGFNWSLWRYPSVVQVPENVARDYQKKTIDDGDLEFANQMESGFLKDGYWYGRWDGDHRTHIWKLSFPNTPLYQCVVYPVNSIEVANELFVKIQKLNLKSLSPEDTLVNLYYGKDNEALKIGKWLEECNLCISNSEEGIVPSSATNSTVKTRVRLFEESVKNAGLEETKISAAILSSGLSKISKWNKEVSPTLLYGLALLFKVRPDAMKNGLNKALTDYIHDSIRTSPKQKDLVQLWGSVAGDKHNKEAHCVAVGIASKLRSAVENGSYAKGVHVVNPLKVQSIRQDLGLEF